MARTILFAAALLLIGGVLGNGIARYSARQHQHTRAVMALAQFHLDRLAQAARAGQCPDFGQERERLSRVYDELLQAFPLTLAQDPEFRKRADALRDAVQGPTPMHDCSNAHADAKAIGDACEECHREYR